MENFPIAGARPDKFTFDPDATTIALLTACGCATVLSSYRFSTDSEFSSLDPLKQQQRGRMAAIGE
jgi:hypothetical protein